MPHNKFVINPTRRLIAFYKRRPGLVIALLVALVLCGVVGQQLYAYNVSQTNKNTAAAVKQLSKGQCQSTKVFYTLLNDLALDTSPHYGSPPNGPVVPGARTEKINRLFDLERKAVPGLAKQGCDVSKIIPKDVT